MLLVVVAACCLPTTAASATRTDPVLTAIAAALKSKAITPAEAVSLRTTWRSSARAERVARTASRRSNIHAVRAYATTLARHRGLTPTRLKPVFLSIQATTTILSSRRAFPHHEQDVRLTGEPLVFKYYSGRGVQFQPFETFKLGVDYLTQDPPKVGVARRIADRMLELDAATPTSTSWEFYFPFGGPATPWRSAIAQAHALRMYSLLAQQVSDAERPKYLAAADAIVQTFLRSPAAQGVSVTQGTGKFYVMYSFNPAQRILNGHLQSLLSLHRYAVETGSTAAQTAYDRGYAALVPLMPRFDRGDWSNYQLGQEADRNYHEFMTAQLSHLAEETRDPFFIDYARRFRIYLEDPATLGVRFSLLPSLVLPRDDYRDTIAARFEIDKSARVTLIIADYAGQEQRRITAPATRGINTMYWDGRTATGDTAPDGTYSGRFVTLDRLGRRSTTAIKQPFVIEHDTEAPVPILATALETDGGAGTQVVINVIDSASRWYEGQLFIGDVAVSGIVHVKSGPISVTVPRPRAEVETANIRLVDNSGNESLTPLSSLLEPSTDSG